MGAPVTWTQILQTLALLAVAIWIPGWGALKLAGYSRKDTIFIAPLISAAVAGLGAIVAPFLDFKWGWLAFGIATFASWGIAQFIGFLKSRSVRYFTALPNSEVFTEGSPKNWGIWLGVFIAAPISAWIFLAGIGNIANPPQTWDAVFHLNALRWIEQSGNGSSLHLSALSSALTPAEAASGGIYPAGFHDLVYLGWVNDPAAPINLFVLLIVSLIWPLSMGFMARQIWEDKPFIHTATVVLSVAYTAFPERPASYGTLWPTVYAYALVPVLIGLLIQWFGRTNSTPMQWSTTAVLSIGVIGVGLIHPTGILVALIPTLLLSIDLLIRIIGGKIRLTWKQIILFALLVLAISGAFWAATRLSAWNTVVNWQRAPISSFKRESFGAVFDNQLHWTGFGDTSPDWLLGALTLIGALVALYYSRTRWVVFNWGIYCYFFAASAAVNVPLYFLVSPWYSDPVRLGAMVPIMGAFLAALGLNQCVEFITATVNHKLGNPTNRLRPAIASLALILAVAGTGGLGFTGGHAALDLNYRYQPLSILGGLADQKELAFIRSLPQYVEPGAMIATDPRTGGSLIYAYTGLPVLHRHLDGSWDKDMWIISHFFHKRGEEFRVCDRLGKRNVKYFYTDEILYWPLNPIQNIYDGFVNSRADFKGLELVAESGTAQLYRITNCEELK